MFGQGLTIASSWTASSQNLSLFDHNSLTVLSLSVHGSTRIRLVTILCAKFAWFLATSNSDTRLWFIFYLCPNHSPLALLLLPFRLTLPSFCFVIRGKRVIKRQSRCEDDSFFEQRSREDWKKWLFKRRIFIVFFEPNFPKINRQLIFSTVCTKHHVYSTFDLVFNRDLLKNQNLQRNFFILYFRLTLTHETFLTSLVPRI